MLAEENKGVYPEFYLKAKQNKQATLKEGHPVFEDVEYVRIFVAGDRLNTIDRRVQDEDRRRWPVIYKKFKESNEQVVEGLPIEEWPLITKSQAEAFKFINVRTVEQLANLDDLGLQAYGPGGRDLQNKAKAYLEVSKDSSAINKLADRLAALEIENKSLKDQLKELAEKDKKDKTLSLKK